MPFREFIQKHLDIKRSILGLFGIISALHFAVGFFSFKPLMQIEEYFADLNSNNLPAAIYLSKVERAFLHLCVSDSNYIFQDNKARVEASAQSISLINQVQSGIKDYAPLADTKTEAVELDKWQTAFNIYLEKRSELFDLVKKDKLNEAREFQRREVLPPSQVATIALEHLTVFQSDEAIAKGKNVSRFIKDSKILISILTLLSGMVAAFITGLSVNWISRNQQQKVEMLERISALGILTGSIAHEVKTPLAVVKLGAEQISELLEQDPLDKAMISKVAQRLHPHIARIDSVISGLKAFARDGSKDPLELLLVKDVIDDTLTFCMNKLKRYDVTLKMGSIDENLKVMGRAIELSQVVFNLVDNAIDAVKKYQERWVSFDAIESGGFIEISITDSGEGIPKEILRRIFKENVTTKTGWSGHGLSLLLAKRIITSHSGDITFDENSKNTRVVIRLPKASEEIKAA